MKTIEHCGRKILENGVFLTPDTVIISINEPGREEANLSRYVNNTIYRFYFHDVEEACIYYPNPISEQQAKEILTILENNSKIVVHCHVGISRSAAVSKFARDFLGFDWVTQDKISYPNALVLKLLEEVYTESLNSKYV